MDPWVETLKDALYSIHEDPITITENEGRKLIAEIEKLEKANKKLKQKLEKLYDYLDHMPFDIDEIIADYEKE